jgi:ATP-dependent RNA helicase SUPV3L1/SUV3
MSRKIVFHGGPTNSGKTYHALERFLGAKSGIYCGPLKLLAVEVRGARSDDKLRY